MAGSNPYGQLQYKEINGRRMAYIDEGASGDGHRVPARQPDVVLPVAQHHAALDGLGRLVACDLIGMGDCDKLTPVRPRPLLATPSSATTCSRCGTPSSSATVVLVLHDWGSALGFEWAHQQPRPRRGHRLHGGHRRCRSPGPTGRRTARRVFQGFRSPAARTMMLAKNMFVERVLPGSVLRKLTDEEMAEYRRPFVNPGEDRRPTLSWPRQIPIEGEPADVVAVVEDYAGWLAKSDVPKLFINADPGSILWSAPARVLPRLAQPDRGHRQGRALHPGGQPRRDRQAVAEFVRRLRNPNA